VTGRRNRDMLHFLFVVQQPVEVLLNNRRSLLLAHDGITPRVSGTGLAGQEIQFVAPAFVVACTQCCPAAAVDAGRRARGQGGPRPPRYSCVRRVARPGFSQASRKTEGAPLVPSASADGGR
jgi:hypothetical protein